MNIEVINLIANIVLSSLSLILAAVSVITVIISLKQNNKILQINSEQIIEMRKEHEFSLQPVLSFSNPVFIIEKPRLFYSPPEDAYSIQSRFDLDAKIVNNSSAVAVNIICSGKGILGDKNENFIDDTCSNQINFLSDNNEKISFMFLENKEGAVLNSLRELRVDKLPQFELETIYKNTTGGAFRIKTRYVISPEEDVIDCIKSWHSLILSSKADYKDELYVLSESHGENKVIFNDLKSKINNRAGKNTEIRIRCVELKQFFTYETISIEEYNKIASNKSFPTFLGKR